MINYKQWVKSLTMNLTIMKMNLALKVEDLLCMSREMMEMDGLDSAKCQKSRRKDIMGIKWKFNDNKTKIWNSGHLLHLSQKNVQRAKMGMQWLNI